MQKIKVHILRCDTVVVDDTGWHTDVRTDMKKYLGPVLYSINKALLPEDEAIHEQLKALGYKSSDIDYLLLSHLDCDHVSDLKLVADAKNILVSEKEL